MLSSGVCLFALCRMTDQLIADQNCNDHSHIQWRLFPAAGCRRHFSSTSHTDKWEYDKAVELELSNEPEEYNSSVFFSTQISHVKLLRRVFRRSVL